MAEIGLQRITKTFGHVRAVDDVDISIGDGEFLVLLGPSGCGKTTLLRSIAGLEQIDSGRVLIGGRDVTDLPPRKRRIAMVFQSYAVFPHLTVFENIAFGLRMARTPGPKVKERVTFAAELLHIEDLLDRHPSQISGGQRQRVAVARAIAMEPQVLLMDEPLSNLDALLRMEARAELKRLLKELGSTTVYVTHDQVEALSMGDRIAVMRSGRIRQIADPLTIYDKPADRFVAGFIGSPPMNFLTATLERRDGSLAAVLPGTTAIGLGSVPPELAERAGKTVILGIRAENIEVHRGAGGGLVPARCLVVEPLGSHNLLTLRLGDEQVKATTRPGARIEPDDEVGLRFEADRIRWLDPESGHTIEAGRASAGSTLGAAIE